MDIDFLRPIIEGVFAGGFSARDAQGRHYSFRLRGLETRRDAIRFELGSDTHHEDLSLAVRLTTAEFKEAFEESTDPLDFGVLILRRVSKATEERLAVPVLLEALELDTKPRERDGWLLRRISPFEGAMYLEGEPSNMGSLGGGKGLVHTRWVGEPLRDLATRFTRERAEEIALGLAESDDEEVYEVLRETEAPP